MHQEDKIAKPVVNGRIAWCDWAKAILIFFMVLCHAGLRGVSREIIYSFHMPAFFIISGYLFHPKDWKSVVIPFIAPVLFFSLIVGCSDVIRLFAKGEGVPVLAYFVKAVPGYWKFSPPYLFPGFWFIFCLITARLVLGIAWVRRNSLVVALFCILFMFADPWIERQVRLSPCYIHRTIAALAFMIVGLHWKQNGLPRLTFVSKMILLVCWLGLVRMNEHIDIFMNDYGRIHFSSFFVAAVLGSLLFFSLCDILPRNSLVEHFSSGTLVTFGLHMPLVVFFYHLLSFLGMQSRNPRAFVIAIFVHAVCICFIVFFNRHAPVLLGKQLRRSPKQIHQSAP